MGTDREKREELTCNIGKLCSAGEQRGGWKVLEKKTCGSRYLKVTEDKTNRPSVVYRAKNGGCIAGEPWCSIVTLGRLIGG